MKTLLDWFGTFWNILISPTPSTFRQEAQKAHGKIASAGVWLVLFAIYMAVMIDWAFDGTLTTPNIAIIVALLPTVVILFVVVLNILCYRIFGRKDHFTELLYISVAILVPIFVIFAPLAAFVAPQIFSLLGFILILYQVAQLTIGVKTITEIEYWQSFVIVFLSIIAGIVMGFIVFIMLISTVAPPERPRLPTPTF